MRTLKRICFSLFSVCTLGLAFPALALAAPDLIPTASSAATRPATAVTGANILTATITNQGNASTGAGFSNFFQVASSSNGAGNITDLPATSMPALAASATNRTSQIYTFPAAGTYSYRVCADGTSSAGGGVITESSEGNNCGGGTGGGGWQNITITDGWGSPDTPVMMSASCTSGTASLAWGAISGTPSYLTMLKVPAGVSCPAGWSPWISANTCVSSPIPSPQTTSSVSGLSAQTGYEAFVYAYQDNEGLSGESNHIAFSCDPSTPATPAAPVMSAASCTSGATTLSWGAVSGADAYEPILRLPTATGETCPAGWSYINDFGSGVPYEYNVQYCTKTPSGTTATASGLTAGEGYGAFVYAEKAGIWSSDSNHSGFTCPPSPSLPVPPGLSATTSCSGGDVAVAVKWDLCSQSKGNSIQLEVDTTDPQANQGTLQSSDCAGTYVSPGFVAVDDAGGYYIIATPASGGTPYQTIHVNHPPIECYGLPDLTVDAPVSVSSNPSVGSPTTFTATVRNDAPDPTPTGFYNLFQYATGLDGNGNGIGVTDIAMAYAPALAAKQKSNFLGSLLSAVYMSTPLGSASTAQTQDSYTFTSPGTYYVRVCADKSSAADTGTVNESDENNNCSSPWTSVSVTSICPTAGQPCNSPMNACGMYNSGTYNNDVGCTCSASKPADSLCSSVTPTATLQGPQRIQKGQATTLSWSAQGVTSCTLNGPLVQSGSNVSSITFSADAGHAIATTISTTQSLQTLTTFKLTCTATSGGTFSVQTVVNLVPQANER